MSEEKAEVVNAAEPDFWSEVNWESVAHNAISREDFVKIKARNNKLFATFLGPKESAAFYLFKPLKWGVYKDIRSKNLDKETINEYVVNACVLWPIMDPIQINDEDAGIINTLVYMVLSISNFLSVPEKALDLIYSVS